MIIGFGFGDPLTSLLMLLVTSVLSYLLFRAITRPKNQKRDLESERERLRAYYYNQREVARKMMEEFDLTDDEIEQKITERLRR